MGAGLEPGTELGRLVDERHRRTVDAHVAQALDAGADALRRRAGRRAGLVLPGDGAHRRHRRHARHARGDVRPGRAGARRRSSFDEAIGLANATEHGLAASVLTCSQEYAAHACHELRTGTVKVNAVWGGAPGGAAQPRGASGFGYGTKLLDELTLTKVVDVEPGIG